MNMKSMRIMTSFIREGRQLKTNQHFSPFYKYFFRIDFTQTVVNNTEKWYLRAC